MSRNGGMDQHQGRRWGRAVALILIGSTLTAGCATQPTTTELPASEPVPVAEVAGCADVVDVVLTLEGPGTYRFDVTVRSTDTGWDQYADLWEIRTPEGTILGQRVLTHPHVDEQPFTRSQSGIEVPTDVGLVTVIARDSVGGFCGEPLEIDIP